MTLAEGEDGANDPVYTHIPLVSLETKDTAPSGLIGHFLREEREKGRGERPGKAIARFYQPECPANYHSLQQAIAAIVQCCHCQRKLVPHVAVVLMSVD